MSAVKRSIEPPGWADKFLAWYCSGYRLEEIQGDLHELFRQRLTHHSVRKARLLYAWDVIRCLKPYAFRKAQRSSVNSTAMFKNYLTIAVRSLLRNKTYAAINIFCLALGIVCFTFIYLYVRHELSYDRFHSRKAQIYTVPFTWHFGHTDLPTARATSNVGPLLKDEFPEVLNFIRFRNPGTVVMKTDLITAQEQGVLYADSSFFRFFDFTLIEGDPVTSLVRPRSIVITEELAARYFGPEWRAAPLIGGTLTLERQDYLITGIIQSPPDNSHIQFKAIASFSSLPESQGPGDFDNSAYMTYVLTENDIDISALQRKTNAWMEQMFDGKSAVSISFRPLTDIYLKSHMSTGVGPISDIKYVYIFGLTGLVIILIACVNYINLTTARSVERAKEVGVRKVMGAIKKQLSLQFLSESFIATFIAVLVGFGVIVLLLPLFNMLTGKSLEPALLFRNELIVTLFYLWVGVAVLAGGYPALLLSRFRVTNVLKGSFKHSTQGSLLRKALVIFQFSISSTLIVGTIVVYQQLQYLQSKNLGFDQEQVISIPLNKEVKKKLIPFKDDLTRYEDILYTAATYQLPGRVSFETTFAEKEGQENRQLLRAASADNDYLKTLSLPLILGGDFDPSAPADEYQFIVNQEVVKFFGWSEEEIIGKRLMIWGGEWGTIRGVVGEFHFSSLHEKIKPMALFYMPGEDGMFMFRHLMVKLRTNEIRKTLETIEQRWKTFFPDEPFSYTFLDDRFVQLYAKEKKLSTIFTVFAAIAVLIGCLGLFGLASYTSFQRSKEIGIRKVLGASTRSIAFLLSGSFTRQVMISLMIAIPLSYFIMEKWLGAFAYRINISWYILLFSAVLILLIAWLTVGYRSVTAAMTNPADILRNE